ncbi:lipase 3-like [Stomoxys calcitrans]|uniref:lipase 3 n=1 Tax=Stomoxys calcitrans TaxID=35570 RepID=UPI0027E2C1FB|nr:lipase 3 [Stomoxys calcitrans]XP_059225974.1 lipase 3-like [Stomoxys calcitrans]
MQAFSIMKAIFAFSLLIISIVLLTLPQQHEEEKEKITTLERVQKAGYSCEVHDTITKDGYVIRVFRVKNATSSTTNDEDTSKTVPPPAVLLNHGLTSTSDSWAIEGLSNSLAFELVDKGYDVWLGNTRGNRYGINHLNMSSNDAEFWNYSVDEIATIDLPRIIDFILAHTKHSSLHYVGYSQGGTLGFILLSMLPEYNQKFTSITMLAPIVFTKDSSAPLWYLSSLLGFHTPLHSAIGTIALFRPAIVRQLLGFDLCRKGHVSKKYCSFVIFRALGGYSAYFDEAILQDVYSSHPSTCSMHQVMHFMQMHYTNKFCQYNFGPEGNQLRYNRTTPPEYNLTNIKPKFPIHIFYSDYDEHLSKTDAEGLIGIMGNRSVGHFIDVEHFSHIDFIWGSKTREYINQPVAEIMMNAEAFKQNNV